MPANCACPRDDLPMRALCYRELKGRDITWALPESHSRLGLLGVKCGHGIDALGTSLVPPDSCRTWNLLQPRECDV
jgi:hypothetical protein